MGCLRLYRRVVVRLAPERGLAITLTLANAALAAAGFLGPLLFGSIVDTLANSGGRARDETWHQILLLLGSWGLVGVGNLGAGILVALHADRLAQRRRLAAMSEYFEHVVRLPYAFHGGTHSGRQLKIMWQGADTLFGVWLSFLRENLATFVAPSVLLPLTLLLNWRLGALVMLLIIVLAALTWSVFRHTHAAQARVEAYHSALAEGAGDALSNIVLVQSFVRLAAEACKLRDAMDQLLAAQFPVLNWWALLTVLSGASSAITLIAIFARHLAAPARPGHGGGNRDLHGPGDAADRPHGPGDRLHQPAVLPCAEARPVLRRAGHSFGHRREAPGDRLRAGPGAGRIRAGQLVLRRPPGGSRSVVRRGSRPDGGAGRPNRRRQEHRGRPAPAPARPRCWDHPLRWRRHPRGHARLAARQHRRGVPGEHAVLSEHRGQSQGRPARNHLGRAAGGRAPRRGARFHPAPAGRLQHAGRRARRHLVGRRAPAPGDRPRAAQGSADPDPDEATSALDAATEARVQQALQKVMRGRTTFVIAHRLSTVREADLILVFEAGRIVERRSFADLLARGGSFAQLVATQLGPLRAEPALAS